MVASRSQKQQGWRIDSFLAANLKSLPINQHSIRALRFRISVLLRALEHELNESRTRAIFARAQSGDEDDTRSRIAVLLLKCAISGRSAVW